MRWSAATFLPVFLLVAVVGCQKPEQEEDLQKSETETALMEPDYYATDPAAEVGTAEDYTATAGGYGDSTSAELTATQAPGGGQTHVVVKGDTLYALARQYYNDQRRWKDIYEANRSQIQNPDLIWVGQALLIP